MIQNDEHEKPQLVQTARGFSVLYRTKYLYSKYNPRQSIVTQIAHLQIPDSTLIICLSPVLGYGLQELAEKLPTASYILAVECDQLLMRLSLDTADPACFSHQRFSYIRTDAVSEVIAKIESLPLFPFKKCMTLICSGGVQLYPDFYEKVRMYADEVISRFWKNRVTLMHLGRNYAHNSFRNLLSLAGLPIERSSVGSPVARASSADGSFADGSLADGCTYRLLSGSDRINKPILAVGAGPSLDSARDFIIKNRKAFFLLAVDAAAAGLLPDIVPDALVLVESQYWIDAAFIGLRKYRIPVFADLTASPRAIRACGGRVAFFCTEYAKLRYLPHLYRALQPLVLQPMGSVGLTALQLALMLTNPGVPVLHTGLDFAWQRGLTHAAGSSPVRKLFTEITRFESCYKLNFPNDTRQIAGKRGESYWTTSVLTGYAELYRHSFAGNGRVFDIGTVGCMLSGRQIRADEAVQLLADIRTPAADTDTPLPIAGDLCTGADVSRTGAETSGSKAAHSAASFWEPDTSGRPDSWLGSERQQAVRRYLQTEYESLSALAEHLRGKRRLPDGVMEQLLAERDYLYSHFPDAARGYSLNIGFLKRVSIELSYMLKYAPLLQDGLA